LAKASQTTLSQEHQMRELLDSHLVNHVVVKIDESSSMTHLQRAVEQVFDGLVADLAQQSRDRDQETRVTVYAFSDGGTERCIVWDCDVLRIPSIRGRYSPHGLTALVDCEVLALDDMDLISQRYGDHAFICYTISDGGENDSRNSADVLRRRFLALPGNVTAGIFVPDQRCARYAREKVGYPEGSIQIWNPNGHNAIEQVAQQIRETNSSFFTGRSQGVRSARSGMFTPGSFSAADVKARLVPLTPGSFVTYEVACDYEIAPFTRLVHGSYPVGRVYYELTKTVLVQDHKDAIIQGTDGKFYSGPIQETRELLGLPHMAARLNPRDLQTGGCRVFIKSTSHNRKLLAGTQVVVLR
jgi:hypothetical protein